MKAKIDMKKHHGGKVKGAGDAPGDAAATGMPKSVAPDVISAPRAAKSGYGMNSYAGPSSLTPMDDSNKGVSLLAANMKEAGERGSDPVLDAIVKAGTAAMDVTLTGDAVMAADGAAGTQIRKIAAGNVPDAHGMKSRQAGDGSPGGTIPSKIGASSAQPIRKPGA
jgi:hypothetical protein